MPEKTANRFFNNVLNFKTLVVVYLLLTAFATIMPVLNGTKVYPSGEIYTKYNNFVIFSKSFDHLKAGENLYSAYPDEYWDLYKYSPTFAVLFAPLSALPVPAGLGIWNLLNSMLLFFALWLLPVENQKRKLLMLLIVGIELLTSMQNQQSNGLMAGLMILAFVFMERGKIFYAAGLLTLSVYIKLFGLVGFALFLFYPQKPKAALYSLLWFAVLFILPLPFSGFHGLLEQYKNWWQMLAADHTASLGLSVMGWLKSWFGVDVNKNIILLTGAIVFMLPAAKTKQWKNRNFRLLMLASTLMWVVIFNHKAESPTFVIAMAGVAIWFLTEKPDKLNISLLILAVIFTSLSNSDIFPSSVRNGFFVPYVIKAFPVIIIWGLTQWRLLSFESGGAKKLSA